MGDTYSFCKVPRKVFLSGKSRFVRDEYGFWTGEMPPEFVNVGDEFDRYDLLYRMVKPNKGFSDSDTELSKFLSEKFNENDEQCIVVTKESVQDAIDKLEELDAKVRGMPFTKPKAGKTGAATSFRKFLKKGDYNYSEYRNGDSWEPDAYFGDSKENVEILKLVESVYGSRYYKFGFPWEDNPYGDRDVVSGLRQVLKDMDYSGDGMVYLFLWD